MAVRRLKIKKNPLPIGPEVTWTQFEEDGTERVRTGLFWSEGPPLSGTASYWVVPDDGEQTAVLVTIAPKRGSRAGRYWEHQINGPAWEPKASGTELSWEPSGGRHIEPGEIYSETHDLTPTGSLTATVQRMRSSA